MRLRTNKGFSLVELMIVVAIIGILAAVAIPNFMRFQAKSRQSEARADLSAIYTAEKAFTAEWQQFLAHLGEIGYRPEGFFRYEHGFGVAGVNTPTSYTGALGANQAVVVGTTSTAGCGIAPAFAAAFGTTQCSVDRNPRGAALGALANGALTATTFVAGAIGEIDDDAVRDIWQIDHNKRIVGPCSAFAAFPCVQNGGDLDN